MNKKPFNLERAMAGDPIMLANGQPAEFISYKEDAPTDRCVCLYANRNFILTNVLGVHCFVNPEYDAFMAPKKTVWWIASYGLPKLGYRVTTYAYPTVDEVTAALNKAGILYNYILHPIEREE